MKLAEADRHSVVLVTLVLVMAKACHIPRQAQTDLAAHTLSDSVLIRRLTSNRCAAHVGPAGDAVNQQRAHDSDWQACPIGPRCAPASWDAGSDNDLISTGNQSPGFDFRRAKPWILALGLSRIAGEESPSTLRFQCQCRLHRSARFNTFEPILKNFRNLVVSRPGPTRALLIVAAHQRSAYLAWFSLAKDLSADLPFIGLVKKLGKIEYFITFPGTFYPDIQW